MKINDTVKLNNNDIAYQHDLVPNSNGTIVSIEGDDVLIKIGTYNLCIWVTKSNLTVIPHPKPNHNVIKATPATSSRQSTMHQVLLYGSLLTSPVSPVTPTIPNRSTSTAVNGPITSAISNGSAPSAQLSYQSPTQRNRMPDRPGGIPAPSNLTVSHRRWER